MNVVVGVITFRRREPLRNLLVSIGQRLDVGNADLKAIVVVDNDPAGSAREVVSDFATSVDYPVEYTIEPTPGISAARNALVEAAGEVDWLAMVDDDEEIVEGWPGELLRVGEKYTATMVAGPVLVDTSNAELAEWMKSPRFFGREMYGEGDHVDFIPTTNCAIHLGRISNLDFPLFDARFGLTGGSDSFLTARVLDAGGKTAFAPGAVTSEMYPADRLTLQWLNRRWRRSGATLVAIDQAMGHLDLRQRARSTCKALVRFPLAAGLIVSSVWAKPRKERVWIASRHVMLGIGTLKALGGWEPNSYGPEGTETASSGA